ncbi:MAG: M67 family metallopeptidase [Terriglobia bacterium]
MRIPKKASPLAGMEPPSNTVGFFGMHAARIKKEILQRMIQHALAESPRECCGLLSGDGGVISEIHPMRNNVQSKVRFEMDPLELFQFFRGLRAVGSAHLGIYHSHPTSEPYPSATDIEESHYPECAYFIVSLKNPGSPLVRAFQIERKKVQGLEIHEVE